MALVVSRSDLVASVKRYLHLENSNFATTAELEELLDRSYRLFYNLLVSAHGHERYRTSGRFATTIGTSLYDLPSDFLSSLTLYAREGVTYSGVIEGLVIEGTGTPHELLPFEEREVVTLLRNTSPRLGDYRYRLTSEQYAGDVSGDERDRVEILPAPAQVFTITVRYLPVPSLTTNLGDTYYNGISGYEEWLILDVCERIESKRKGDTAWILRRKDEIERSLKALAGTRDAGHPPRVADVRGLFSVERRPWGGGRFPWGGQ